MRAVVSPCLALLVALGGFAIAPAAAAGFSGWSAPVAQSEAAPSPPLKLRDWQGVPRDLAEFRGKVVLVNFWASWCEPCREEMPELEELRQQYGERGLEIVAVNLAESQRRIQSFVKAFLPDGMSFVILQDRDSQAYKQWQVRALPTSFLIDREGRLRWKAVGRIDPADAAMLRQIDELL